MKASVSCYRDTPEFYLCVNFLQWQGAKPDVLFNQESLKRLGGTPKVTIEIDGDVLTGFFSLMKYWEQRELNQAGNTIQTD